MHDVRPADFGGEIALHNVTAALEEPHLQEAMLRVPADVRLVDRNDLPCAFAEIALSTTVVVYTRRIRQAGVQVAEWEVGRAGIV